MRKEGGDRTCGDHLLVKGRGHPPTSKFFNPEMFLSKGRTGTKNGAETEGRVIWGPTHLEIHHVCRHQAQHCRCGQEALSDRNQVWQLLVIYSPSPIYGCTCMDSVKHGQVIYILIAETFFSYHCPLKNKVTQLLSSYKDFILVSIIYNLKMT
jgi:hypothetical protein